jgi:hypothetical protein
MKAIVRSLILSVHALYTGRKGLCSGPSHRDWGRCGRVNDGDPSLAGNPSLLRAIDETRGCRVSSIDETEPWATWPDVGRSRDTQRRAQARGGYRDC